jgi:hypothetical protein
MTRWIVMTVLLTAACSNDGDDSEAAADALFDGMKRGDYASADDIIAGLDEAHAQNPDDAHMTFLLGAAHLWRVAEGARDPEHDVEITQTHAPLVGQLFGEALQRDPANAVPAGFFGLFLFDSGLAFGDPAMQGQGEALLGQAAAAHPEFGLFSQALALRNVPVDDPRLQKAVDAFWQWLDVCMGAPVDRADPDLSAFLTPDMIASFTGPRAFCWETSKVPNAAKGTLLIGADLLVKAGAVDAARVMYQNATRVPNYASWPHRDTVDARLTEDLTARAALYRDADPTNDPVQGVPPFTCTVCHEAR